MKKAKSPIEWNKVTPLSKYFAMALFVALPFMGFWLGMKYGLVKYLQADYRNQELNLNSGQPKAIKKIDENDEKNWVTYIDKKYGFSMKHPPSVEILPKHSVIDKPLTEIEFAINDGKMWIGYTIGVTKSAIEDLSTNMLCNQFCHFDKLHTDLVDVSGFSGRSYSWFNKWTEETTQAIIVKRNGLDYYFVIESLNGPYAQKTLASRFKFL